ncbi:hypothetical protein MUN76_00905 [Leucobacter rhizosphaerae]|uniref:DUF2568 domain-containing protein n=1 Tax=Leucobacter rhizosphaerae TaxID=2932245 RepID=A0ABY4FWD2_9MICO|nr:hypothetical protein [Leucobacter rhizosphaerae]UOQ60582.1 hypothetical protein MUN76_00905 [Leucobacter rhizosphaerae]
MSSQPVDHPRSRTGWTILRLVLVIEVVGGAILLWNVFQAFLAAGDEPLGARVSLLLAVLISWAWIAITLWGALALRASWVRGSAITLHVLMLAAATGVLQGILGEAILLGWALLALALVGFLGAVLARPVAPVHTAGEGAGEGA